MIKLIFLYCFLLGDACELWDGCTQDDTNKIERVQHETARIVTGLPKYENVDFLYFESFREILQSRRKRRKLSLFYKIHHQDLMTVYYRINEM